MNPLTNVKNIKKLSELELKLNPKSSWHDQYKDSAWIFVGGLPYDLTEGDILSVFSQYGEIVNINLVRDKETGKQKGYCFICYEDQRSTILAVDNLNSIKILNRTLRVDHVENYKAPKESKKNPVDDEIRQIREQGCAPPLVKNPPVPELEPPIVLDDDIIDGIKLPPRLPIGSVDLDKKKIKKEKKKKEKHSKKNKKEKKRKKKNKKYSSDSDNSDSDSSSSSDEPRRKKKK